MMAVFISILITSFMFHSVTQQVKCAKEKKWQFPLVSRTKKALKKLRSFLLKNYQLDFHQEIQ